MPPAASLSLGAGHVNKWNTRLPENKRIGARPACPIAHWHRLCSTPKCAASASQNRSAQVLPMANSSPIETLRGTAAVNRLQIATLIESLLRSVELLTVDIEHEETRAGVRDLSDPT